MSIQPQLTTTQWVSLPSAIRHKLISIFSIPKSEGTRVDSDNLGNQKLISDGHNHEDLKSISLEKMQVYLGSQEADFFKLFENVLEKLEAEAAMSVEEQVQEVEKENLAKFLLIMRNIQHQCRQLGLTEKFNELLSVEFGVTINNESETSKESSNQGSKKRGKPSTSAR